MPPDVSPLSATPLPPTVPTRPRVLIVDDEPAVRMVARLMLEGAGYVVTEAGGVAPAVERVRAAERAFTVILLDLTLPDGNGIDLIPELRVCAPRTQIVLTSGRSEEDLPEHGADGYLAKPFSCDQLLAAIRAAAAMTPR